MGKERTETYSCYKKRYAMHRNKILTDRYQNYIDRKGNVICYNLSRSAPSVTVAGATSTRSVNLNEKKFDEDALSYIKRAFRLHKRLRDHKDALENAFNERVKQFVDKNKLKLESHTFNIQEASTDHWMYIRNHGKRMFYIQPCAQYKHGAFVKMCIINCIWPAGGQKVMYSYEFDKLDKSYIDVNASNKELIKRTAELVDLSCSKQMQQEMIHLHELFESKRGLVFKLWNRINQIISVKLLAVQRYIEADYGPLDTYNVAFNEYVSVQDPRYYTFVVDDSSECYNSVIVFDTSNYTPTWKCHITYAGSNLAPVVIKTVE